MLIFGIILTILGFLIFQWSVNALSKSFIERPLIFANPIAVLVIHLLWIGLLIGGLILLWQVNPIIVGVIFGGYFILWVIGYFMGSEKTSIKRIFRVYKQLKLFRPKATGDGILKETARLYFQKLRWDEYRINHVLQLIFKEEGGSKVKNIKDLVKSILIFERPEDLLRGTESFTKYMKRSERRDKLIDEIYKKELEEKMTVTERPQLSKDTLERMRQSGIDPDELSNEQLAALETLEKPEKGHWISKVFFYPSVIFFILAIISLFTGEWGNLFIYIVITFILWYIGYTIQSRVAAKQFREASIKKFIMKGAMSGREKKKIFSDCPNCGAKIKKGTAFCTQCGEKIKI